MYVINLPTCVIFSANVHHTLINLVVPIKGASLFICVLSHNTLLFNSYHAGCVYDTDV